MIASAGHEAARARLRALGSLAGVGSRRGDGWVAVRTGLASNDLNGVVAEPGLVPDPALLSELAGWWGDVPACWSAAAPDARLTAVLEGAGWTSERTGWWAGRTLTAPGGAAVRGRDDVRRVRGAADLERWLDVAQACGWFESTERAARAGLARHDGLARWVVVDEGGGGRGVGMVTGHVAVGVVELVDVAVDIGARRRGVGRDLVRAVVEWGRAEGAARLAVAAPSPDGWALLETLGFAAVPVEPDVHFYRAG